MTRKLFWQNPYQIELTSKVDVIDGNKIELAETIFYAESGGQESDVGTIAGIPVIHAEKSGKRLVYTLESSPSFQVGDDVQTLIDWQRRYALMKLHFAAEVVLVLFTQFHPNIKKIGAHISANKSRIDFVSTENIKPLLANIAIHAQQLLDAQLPIESAFSNEIEERRFWKVEGFSQVPCGGTHLRNTSEVGQINLTRSNLGKGKERVEITIL
ncbi:alanine--tRNA ligase-related protein [Vibrio ziniensis]|uniref:Alanyl-tRNA editing protein n=1 Tax=Vibrio ziniensis TaxID=2711221 RepID=A0A6G7CNT9_9VIBR|nr:alanyl-tRNA editing protein [Vibrio ziniensis]QIH43716.1 alanyl-tRNA editing protein [Vibrio ziniensis]